MNRDINSGVGIWVSKLAEVNRGVVGKVGTIGNEIDFSEITGNAEKLGVKFCL
jgi:hypothetical protein